MDELMDWDYTQSSEKSIAIAGTKSISVYLSDPFDPFNRCSSVLI